MQTVIRLKRPLEDSPSDTLILNCSKKQKLENVEGAVGSLSTVLKFTGTQDTQDYDINEHVANIKNDMKGGIKELILQKHKRKVDINRKLNEEIKEHSKTDRYKIVNCLRSISKDESDTAVTVLDIEREEEAGKSQSNKNYVYDLYYTDAKIIGEVEDYDISIHQSSVTFDSDDVYIDSDQESDDSNAENYYKNDYPDASDVESINEDDMVESMRNCELDDLSSTDEEYVHYGDAKEEYDDDMDDLCGNSYKNFKVKYGARRLGDESASDESGTNFDEYD